MRFIDADGLADVMWASETTDFAKGWNDALRAVMENAPTVEIVLNFTAPTPKHGHWILHEGYRGAGWYIRKCSVCGKEGWTIDMNYCPDCGARMDEEVEYDN